MLTLICTCRHSSHNGQCLVSGPQVEPNFFNRYPGVSHVCPVCQQGHSHTDWTEWRRLASIILRLLEWGRWIKETLVDWWQTFFLKMRPCLSTGVTQALLIC